MKDKSIINIGKQDIFWNYLSTFLQMGSGIILFPLILRMLTPETVGIWSIFMTIFSLVSLIDFGFSPSFTRNVTYIFSGVNSLRKKGISTDNLNAEINYELLLGTIKAMKWLYSRMALLAFILLTTVGSYYIWTLLGKDFAGDKNMILIAWVLFCLISTYNIYTLYYDSLMMGRGLVKVNKQIIILSQILYIVVSVVLLLLKFDLISIVIAQAVSVLCRRLISYHVFFNKPLKTKLEDYQSSDFKEIILVILPNSLKLGITSLGAFLVLQTSVIIGSLYVSLEKIASYGITVQAVNLIASLSIIYYSTYIPKLGFMRVENNIAGIRKIYRTSVFILMGTFLTFGAGLVIFGNVILVFLKSQTFLLSQVMIIVILIITFLEKNHAMAGGFLVTKNEVPFFKAAIISGVATVIVLFILIDYCNMGLWAMILAPGIVQLVYQNWKWPLVLIKELKTDGNHL